MTIEPAFLPHRRGRVIALHCSGGGASQWRHLTEALLGCYDVAAPEHYGHEACEQWGGEHTFCLADEAARSIAMIDGCDDATVHVVGHSYGGGVALAVALARQKRIGSLALYEPSAFNLLRHMGERGVEAFAEIAVVARIIGHDVLVGDCRSAVAAFVDYWNGPGSWSALRPAVRSALIRSAPKLPLEFRALMDDPTPAEAYAALKCPVLLMRGEHAPLPTRTVWEGLREILPFTRSAIIDGAGHMGPVTHKAEVSALIVRHIADAERASLSRCDRRNGHFASIDETEREALP